MNQSPELTRREFHVGAGAVLLGGAIVVPISGEPIQAKNGGTERDLVEGVPVCDFQSSFMTWDFPYRKDPRPHARHNIPHGNMARIQLDSLIDVIDRRSRRSERFALIAPCRTEWVYAEDRLFQIPSREYRNIYSLTEQRSMGRSITDDGEPTRGRPRATIGR